MPILSAGFLMNALAITLNGGVMPAAAAAERAAGLKLGPGFATRCPWLTRCCPGSGDIIPWPGPFPNVLSVGGCLIYAGTLVLLHGACARDRVSPALAEA